jgi:hypothetical protein
LQEIVITWGVAAVLLLLALWLSWPMLRQAYNRWRMERSIASSGVEKLRDVLLDDGMGGLTYYEWLLLTPTEIKVLFTSSRYGIIFAGERMDAWAQVIGKRTTKFNNPLYTLEESVGTLRYHLPNLTIEGSILFTGNCSFPKGRPAQVLMAGELAGQQDESASHAVQPVLEQAWNKLKGMVRKVDPATEGYLLPVKEESSYRRWGGIALLLMVMAGWLFWRYSSVL